MWPIINDYERQMEELVALFPDAEGPIADVLAQVARELMLLQSSDWPFLMSTGQAESYASLRFRTHAARFDLLVDELMGGRPAADDAAGICELDNPFPDVDYRAFVGRQSPLPPRRVTFSH